MWNACTEYWYWVFIPKTYTGQLFGTFLWNTYRVHLYWIFVWNTCSTYPCGVPARRTQHGINYAGHTLGILRRSPDMGCLYGMHAWTTYTGYIRIFVFIQLYTRICGTLIWNNTRNASANYLAGGVPWGPYTEYLYGIFKWTCLWNWHASYIYGIPRWHSDQGYIHGLSTWCNYREHTWTPTRDTYM